ncbi:chemotaxis protein CheA [Ruminiclostridium cellulolyticum]|uniref:Chemotaxis protein CheA n=1 Tax=Ruminiclostridium cellulolyticum (strain ATCC 35319 / DSM 5812 / JCM 6584 / H10) TaxID=394503 RepID=B8I4Z7_RUMCH|nr:chemotaxis protein CheA [Ruminiclostridium cellulolyticum]ACL76651.1 CheA signal transduction histidine kinase [Ruminiclostridium cellulolyticum H10]
MSGQSSNESMLEIYLYETDQLIEQLETIIIESEKIGNYTSETINEIFRIMHTIKGSSAMMFFNEISTLAHTLEDLFFFIRKEKNQYVSFSAISDIVLDGVDFIKVELEKIKRNDTADGKANNLIAGIRDLLSYIKKDSKAKEAVNQNSVYSKLENALVSTSSKEFQAVIRFEDGCEMENIRAYSVIHNLKQITEDFYYIPEDIIDDDNSSNIIQKNGFKIFFNSDKTYDELYDFFSQIIFLKDLKLVHNNSQDCGKHEEANSKWQEGTKTGTNTHQSMISVNVLKLDTLMDLVGEMVIAEAMVTQNTDLKNLDLPDFYKAARQMRKIHNEIQQMVMSIRMVPLATSFHKMHRIVRDMCKKLDKKVDLVLIGENTEVDKNIIEHISDPLMHLIRNSIDHGIETTKERLTAGKPERGTLTLEAKNSGSYVLIMVKDDGRGLDKNSIMNKARENGLIHRPENEMLDREIYNLIFLPGFTTNNNITEFSGRGVGMDVVAKNIEAVGGSVSVDSTEGKGTVITFKIPLTLAIIDGMNIKVGNSRFTVPTTAIKESFRPGKKDLITDPDQNEMIIVRGICYPVYRLHRIYNIKTEITEFDRGIFLMVEQDEKSICIFADELLGQQQVVVKTLPPYIKKIHQNSDFAGCTLLGDGNISLIFDVSRLIFTNKI